MPTSPCSARSGYSARALAIADGLGLPREVTWRVLAHTPLAAQAARRRAVVESGDFLARFALAMARKDADLIVAAADAASVDVRLARAARSWLADAESAGLGNLDYTAGSRPHPVSPREAGIHRYQRRRHHCPCAALLVGGGCDGWRLVDTTGLSVIEERMPPGAAEEWHVHDRARQFFYVLDGQATMRTLDGEIAFHAGAGVQIAPNTPHQMANTCGRDLRFLVISAPTTRGDRRPCPEPLQIGEQA